MMAFFVLLAKVWRLLPAAAIVAGLGASFLLWRSRAELQDQLAAARASAAQIEAANGALSSRLKAAQERSEHLADRVNRLAGAEDDGCLDRGIPAELVE